MKDLSRCFWYSNQAQMLIQIQNVNSNSNVDAGMMD